MLESLDIAVENGDQLKFMIQNEDFNFKKILPV